MAFFQPKFQPEPKTVNINESETVTITSVDNLLIMKPLSTLHITYYHYEEQSTIKNPNYYDYSNESSEESCFDLLNRCEKQQSL